MQIDKKYALHDSTGISLIVERGLDRYEVTVKIPKKSISDEIHIETQQFAIHLSIFEQAKNSSEDLIIKYSKGYNFAKYRYIRNKPSIENFKSGLYKGYIKLAANFYIQDSRRASKSKLKNAAEQAKSLRQMEPSKPAKPSPSKYTPYKNSNVGRPYSGGLMQPKWKEGPVL